MKKLIIVFYVDVQGMSAQRANKKIAIFADAYSNKVPDAIEYFIPTLANNKIEFYSADNLDELTIEKLENLSKEIKSE